MDLGLSGLASGFDWRSLVDQLIEVERAPERRLRSDQTMLQHRNQACGSISTQLLVLQNRLDQLTDPELFAGRVSSTTAADLASVQALPGATLGRYTFSFSQLATAARQRGSLDVGKPLSATDNVSALTLNGAAFGAAITPGTLTVNGKQITITASETLQSVFDKIHTATGTAVSATYNATSDKISLSSTGPIVLGSGTDTSNLFEVAKLYNNGSGAIASTTALGGVKLGDALADSNLATAISDGGSGAGEFKINGVSISFDAAVDSVQHILDRINHSAAGVTATYDRSNDGFTLVSKTTGDVGIGLEDVTGNFLAATGLQGGTLERGKNLLYTIDGGEQLVARSNTITEASSGLPGLSVTALKEGSTDVNISSDTTQIKSALQDFLTDYNKVQTLIDTLTASSTDSDGKVTTGILAGDSDAFGIASKLRALANSAIAGTAGSYKSLENLGITSNGNDNTLLLENEGKLDAALSGNLDAIKTLFADETDGLAVRLTAYLEKSGGDEGALGVKQGNLTKQSAQIDAQIADFERRITAERQRLIDRFVTMETAQSNLSSQLQYLTQGFGSTS